MLSFQELKKREFSEPLQEPKKTHRSFGMFQIFSKISPLLGGVGVGTVRET
jgi:hypothetical protein